MKRLFLLSIVLLLTVPVLAQSLDESYTFVDTGTQINYESGLDAELSDEILVLSSESQQVLVIDYPFVNFVLLDTDEPSLEFLVEVIANEISEDEIDTDAIYRFDVNGRDVAAYDMEGFQVPGNVFALEFSNGGIGMLVTFNLSERVVNAMLESFDSVEEIIDDTSIMRVNVQEKPTVYLFRSDGRFIAPANWSVEGRLKGELEYVNLISPDEETHVILIDFSQMLKSGTALEDVIEESEVDWFNDYDVRFGDDELQPYDIGDREAISYDIQVRNILGTFDGQLIVMRLSDETIVAAIIYGDIDAYAAEISQILGSFNTVNSILELMS